jgi:hypothetical protein
MNKKVTARLNELVNKMAENSFLMPDGFSDVIDLQANDYSYKTYVGNRRLHDRYIGIYIMLDGKEITEVFFSSDGRIIVKKEVSVNLSMNKFLELVELIYNEKHSFANHNEGARKLRKSIREATQKIKSIEKEIKSYREQLDGLKHLKTSKHE